MMIVATRTPVSNGLREPSDKHLPSDFDAAAKNANLDDSQRAAMKKVFEARIETIQDGGKPQDDSYASTLMKYIPGEVVSFSVALFAAAQAASGHVPSVSTFGWLDSWVDRMIARDAFLFPTTVVQFTFLLGLIMTPVYYWVAARLLSKELRPRFWFWPLSIVSYTIWILSVSKELRTDLAVADEFAMFCLAAGAFVIPGIDKALGEALPLGTMEAWKKKLEPLPSHDSALKLASIALGCIAVLAAVAVFRLT